MTDANKIKQHKNRKKISFITAIFMVMGSSIGAGIFFKSNEILTFSQGSLALAITSWVIGFIAVLCMGLALVEISSAKSDNLSFVGWCREFNSRFVYKIAKNFTAYLCLPLTFFIMPLYAIQSFQDGLNSFLNTSVSFGTNVDWIIWCLISIGFGLYFVITSGLSLKFGTFQNNLVLLLKFIPLVFIIVMGFILVGKSSTGISEIPAQQTYLKTLSEGASVTNIYGFGGAIGIFLSIAAVFFAYDGFFAACGIEKDMKNPKQMPLAIIIGIGATTVIYLFIGILLSINGGTIVGMSKYSSKLMSVQTSKILYGVMNILIAIGVLGIVNSFAIWAPSFYTTLIKKGELIFWTRYIKRLKNNEEKIGVLYTILLYMPMTIIFSVVGALGYFSAFESDEISYGIGMAKLYNFTNTIANWQAVFTFVAISLSILGGIVNRKTNRVEVNQKKYFLVTAWISVIITFISMLAVTITPIIDLIDLAFISHDLKHYSEIVSSRIVTVIILFVFIFICCFSSKISDFYYIRKFKSLENFHAWKKQYIKNYTNSNNSNN